MATLPSPTIVAERWGPERWQLFNYYANPVRDGGGGNPCLIWRTGGGGWSGSFFTGTSDYPGPLFDKLWDPTNRVHFDLVSVQTCQQFIDEPGNNVVPRTTRHHMWDNIIDHKRAVAAIKAWGQGSYSNQQYKIDPNRVITGGHSFGGTVSGLSMITEPIDWKSSFRGISRRRFESRTFNSRPKGTIWYSSQVDFRNRLLSGSVQDYLDPSVVNGIFGTRINNNGNEWGTIVPSQFKESVSLLAYIEKTYLDYYVPLFVIYQNASIFTHTYPLNNNHDSQMGVDLRAALTLKGLSFGSDTVPTTTPEPTPMTTTNATNIYNWMASLV